MPSSHSLFKHPFLITLHLFKRMGMKHRRDAQQPTSDVNNIQFVYNKGTLVFTYYMVLTSVTFCYLV